VSNELHECLTEIAGASHRAAALTRQLLVFSRQEQIDRRPTCLPSTLGDFMKMLRRIIGEHIEVRLVMAPDVPSVLADHAQIEQVVLNLAVNARDAMPAGGRLDIEVDQITLTQPEGSSGDPVPPGRYARLRFTDTGCGIRADVRQRIFEPFFTTKPVGEGTGLGLAICRSIALAMGGEIEVDIAPATTFRVRLPAAPPAPATTERPREQPPVRSHRVLVIDDEPSVGGLLRRVLPEHEIVAETSARVALARLHRGERFDHILCDLMMPDLTGMDFYDALADVDRELQRRVIFITAGAFTERARTFLAQVTNPRLDKPFDVAEVAALLATSP